MRSTPHRLQAILQSLLTTTSAAALSYRRIRACADPCQSHLLPTPPLPPPHIQPQLWKMSSRLSQYPTCLLARFWPARRRHRLCPRPREQTQGTTGVPECIDSLEMLTIKEVQARRWSGLGPARSRRNAQSSRASSGARSSCRSACNSGLLQTIMEAERYPDSLCTPIRTPCCSSCQDSGKGKRRGTGDQTTTEWSSNVQIRRTMQCDPSKRSCSLQADSVPIAQPRRHHHQTPQLSGRRLRHDIY